MAFFEVWWSFPDVSQSPFNNARLPIDDAMFFGRWVRWVKTTWFRFVSETYCPLLVLSIETVR
jgi:hypothetical protein